MDERHAVDNLAENLHRLMDAESITLCTLAGLANIDARRGWPKVSTSKPRGLLDEVCNLAECLGTTPEALIGRAQRSKAGEWTLNAHDWHKRPADCGKEDPCPVCGCPAAGTRKGGTWHRATWKRKGFLIASSFGGRGRSGWEHKGIVARTLARNPASRES